MKKCSLRVLLVLIVLIQLFPFLSQAQIEWEDYPYPLRTSFKDRVRFGYLTVPETRNENNVRNLKIGFCVLKSSLAPARKDPVIYLPGGPGQGFTDRASYFLEGESINGILEERDIVLFDPRGCGTSEPQLCPDLVNPEIINASFTGISNPEYQELLAKSMRKCRDSLIGEGADTESYGSSDIANDIEDLRIALGYEKWNLRGHSYGTRYAQSVLRQYPDRVRSAILSGVVPSSLSYEDRDFYGLVRSLRLAIEQCAADKECQAAYPDLEENLLELLRRVQENPIILGPGTTSLLPKSSMVLGPKEVLFGILEMMYSREGFETLPLLIDAVSDGKDWIADALAFALGVAFQIDGDMFYFIRCNDNPGVRFAPTAVIDDRLVGRLYPYWRGDQSMTEEVLCKNLSIELDTAEQLPVSSKVPILLYTGEFDPVTPPYYTDSVVKYMTNATSFVVPGRGHDSPVPLANLMAEFFRSPNIEPDLKFLENLEPAQFLTNVHLNKGISAISLKFAKNDYLDLVIIIGVTGLAILLGFLYFSYQLFAPFLKRGRRNIILIKYLPVWSLMLLCFLFCVLLYLALMDAMDTNHYLLMFGVSSKWSVLFYLIWLIVLAWVLCSVFAKKIWSDPTDLVSKFFWVLSFSSAGCLLIFLGYWGLV